jgi:hypothetical protein
MRAKLGHLLNYNVSIQSHFYLEFLLKTIGFETSCRFWDLDVLLKRDIGNLPPRNNQTQNENT